MTGGDSETGAGATGPTGTAGTSSPSRGGGGGSNGNGSYSLPPVSPPPVNGGATVTTFYHDDSDNLSSATSQMSPGFRSASVSALMRPTQNPPGSDSPEAAYFTDERRPSVASVTTNASSQASKSSVSNRAAGGLRKLQGFFGEEYPGRDSSDTSLPPSFAGKESRSHSYSHASRPHRDRNHSNATDHTRDASPASSRPRTPVPAPEVVPFLYQEAEVRVPVAFLSPLFPPCFVPSRVQCNLCMARNSSRPANLISHPRSLCYIRTLFLRGACWARCALCGSSSGAHCNSAFTHHSLLQL